jgi:DNA-binding GntR family transcriptional regulator
MITTTSRGEQKDLSVTIPARPLSQTKAAAAYQEVRRQILSGVLEPGSIVNQEVLATSLGLSTTPVREALRLLEAEGFVTFKAHHDLVVASLTRRELSDVLNLRLELDPYAASLATKHASDGDRRLALELAHRPAPQDPRDQLGANRLFHRTIYAASGNQILTQVLDSLWDRTDRYRMTVMGEREHRELVEHEHHNIAEAFINRRSREIATLVREHVVSARQLLMHFTV